MCIPDLYEDIVDACAIGKEETAPRTELVEEEELLPGALSSVIPLLGLFHTVLVVCHGLFVGKGNAIHTLHSHLWHAPTL